jgi:hypothetical protein
LNCNSVGQFSVGKIGHAVGPFMRVLKKMQREKSLYVDFSQVSNRKSTV